jgi:ATP-dependent DNA helicase RecG
MAQKKSAWQILKDMERPRPMNRLLEGDVGSGKTVVAAMGILNTARAGWQVAFMAPTEILAKQHFKEVSRLLADFKLDVALLTGKEDKITTKKLRGETLEISRQKILEKSLNGEINILIGTHALIQDTVKFKNLALVIVDEQHRFGVEQRAKLTKQKTVPHLLSMTATPIPRTLALTLYGDLDLSIIDQLPQGRKKIITRVISPKERQKTYDFVRQQIKKGRQAFVICPRIEPGKKNSDGKNEKEFLSWAEVKAVKEEYEKLSKKTFPDLKLAMLHGRMKTKEKEKIMKSFSARGGSAKGGKNKIDILVCTSVVEVGIDIPNATVMLIEGAERFGLAQLHQFRGRVGRSVYQSYCFLFTDSPAKKTKQRLAALISAENGFQLSEKDLEIRGPGQLDGSRQWGLPDLAMSALKNMALVEKAREAAKSILINDWQLKKYPLLRARLREFEKRLHLE